MGSSGEEIGGFEIFQTPYGQYERLSTTENQTLQDFSRRIGGLLGYAICRASTRRQCQVSWIYIWIFFLRLVLLKILYEFCLSNGFRDNGTLLLAAKDTPLTHDRDDLKITLKVFLYDYSISEVEAAIDATLAQLSVENIEQLIIDFPPVEDDEVDQAWLDKILAVWKDLEKHVQSGKVVSIGVSDFNLKALQTLNDAAEIKPCVNHYNIDGCCVVSLSLKIIYTTNYFPTGPS